MDKEQIERECVERVARYSEELKKFEELLNYFISASKMQVGKAIVSPKRLFNAAALEEAKQKLDKLRQEMDEAYDRLYEAYR